MNNKNYTEKFCSIPAGLRVKDVDEANQRVSLAVSAFGNEDYDKDTIFNGAYLKTIKEHGPQSSSKSIKHLYQHERVDVIGRPEEMVETDNHLQIVSILSNKQLARDVIEDYKLDLYEHSVGIFPVKYEMKKSGNGMNIYEVAMREYSTVTWGANSNTPFLGFKSLAKTQPVDVFQKLSERMSLLTNAIAKGNYTDERFETLHVELNQIQNLYKELFQGYELKIKSLSENKEPGAPTPIEEQPIEKQHEEPNYNQIFQKNFTDRILSQI